MLWEWSHTHPQPAWGAVFCFFRSRLHRERLWHGGLNTPQLTPFWFPSSKMKFMFIIHKLEDLCYSSVGWLCSVRVSLALMGCPADAALGGVSGPACKVVCEVEAEKELTGWVSPLWARHCWPLTLRVYQIRNPWLFRYMSKNYSHRKRKKSMWPTDELCLLHRLVDIFRVLAAAAWLSLKSFIPLRGRFPAQLLCQVSYLAWPGFSAKPRLSLVLITHSFNRKCLHFQLSVGGWRADKLWMETQNRFRPHPQNVLWSEKEPGPPPAWTVHQKEEGWFSCGQSEVLPSASVQKHWLG